MIPVFEPIIGKKEFEYVKDCFDTNWISFNGKYNKKFEEDFAKFCEVEHGIMTTNGTSALHLALAALKIGKGDEVIVSDFTMASPAFAVEYTGAKPIFVDSERETWNINPTKIEEKITDKTKALLIVHIYGHPCDMDPIMAIAKKHNLKVVEDCAEAHGATYNGKKVGSFGDVAAFSFYANKIITTGEGGMVVTNNKELAERARWLHSLAFDKERRHIHEEIGFNYRTSNVIAAIGVAQLERVDEIIEKKRWVAETYNKYLKDVEGITGPVEKEGSKNVYWMYAVVVEDSFGMSRDQLKEKLYKEEVDSRFFFTPLHAQPCFKNYKFDPKDYPVGIELAKKGLYLPSSINLTEDQIKFICDKIKGLKK